jgi:hypothetical protein
MDANAFYGLFSATCFALVGLWWKVVESRPQWFKDDQMKSLAGGVYLSFLIPGLMGLGAQVAGSDTPLWRVVFVVGAALGMYYTWRLLAAAKTGDKVGIFRRNRWLAFLIYALILAGSLGLDKALASFVAPIQVEAFLMCLLILLAHGLAWDFLTEAQVKTESK